MSDGKDLNTEILNKLEGLERRYRRLKMFVTGGMAVAALALTGAFTLTEVGAQLQKSELEAQLLIIRDAQGNRRVLVGINDNGDAGMWVLNESGSQRVVVSGSSQQGGRDDTGVWVLDQQGRNRVTMASGPTYSGIWITESGRDDQIRMTVSNGDPRIQFRDRAGQVFQELP